MFRAFMAVSYSRFVTLTYSATSRADVLALPGALRPVRGSLRRVSSYDSRETRLVTKRLAETMTSYIDPTDVVLITHIIVYVTHGDVNLWRF